MNRMWKVAAVPPALMALMLLSAGAGLLSPHSSMWFWMWLAILAGALVTGLCVLFVLLAGWWHGSHSFRRGDILAATALALLDLLIPTTLAVLLWLLLRNLKF
ncbi:MAG TPA: hypothetical protein VGA87_06760 [Pyrinomonadaceae bacterium]|jgi:hypothetical protein